VLLDEQHALGAAGELKNPEPLAVRSSFAWDELL